MLKLVAAEDLLLLEDLKGVHLAGVLLLHQEHLAVAALADHGARVEVLHAHSARANLGAFAHLLHLVDGLLVSRLLHHESS